MDARLRPATPPGEAAEFREGVAALPAGDAARDELEAAVSTGRQALRVVGSTESWDFEAGLRMDLAPVLQRAGLDDEAHLLAAEAIQMYERKGISVLAARACDVLASLSA